jgi:hypothetical protein
MFCGHSYFGVGRLIAVGQDGLMVLAFGYPYGVKEVSEASVQPVQDTAWGLGLLYS